MKDKFQSKAVPRGTRTIWRYLSALFILFTFAIGNVWAEDTVFKCKMNGSVVQERNDGNSGDFFSFSFSSGSYGWKGGSDVTGCTYDGVNYTSALKFDSKPTLSFTTTKKATIIVVQSTSKNSSKAPKFDGTAMTSKTEISGANVWTITDVAAGSHNVRYSSEIWIHCVYVVYPAPAVNYTVTIDPNGGAYASTPEGWTENAGKYTKSIAAGEFTPPTTGLTKGTDDLSWKDNHGTDITFPITLAKDSTFVAQWTAHSVSSDATLSALTVDGVAVDGFAAATEEYNVVLPFGTTVVPTVAGTANDANAKSVVVTQASSVSGDATVVVTAENDATKTYTIHFSVATTKLIDLVWKTGQSACEGAGSQASQIKSNNSAVSGFIKPISFINAEGSGDNAAEGGSLNTGKKAGNIIIIQTQPGYLFTTMSFFGKIESADTKCQISIDGGDTWSDLASTSGSDATYCNVVSGASTNDIRIKSAGVKGTWIRNMQLTITTGCSPVSIAWNDTPVEFEVGKADQAIAATANNGTITYETSDGDVIGVNASTGALTVGALGTVTLSASVPEGDGTLYCTNGGSPISISASGVKTYHLVTFNPQNGEDATPVKFYAGDDAIALPSVSWPGYDFKGWFDAASDGNKYTAAITPSASIAVYAQWEAQCDGPTISTQPVGANYIIGRTPVALSCEATAGNGGALTYEWFSCDMDGNNAVSLGASAPTPNTAAAGTFYYFCQVTEAGCAKIVASNIVTVTVAPKEGAVVISIAVPNGNGNAQEIAAANISGFVGGTAYQKLQSGSTKLGSNGHYIGFTLANSEVLQAGDIIRLNVSATNDASHLTLYQDASDANLVKDIEWASTTGVNLIPMPDEAIDLGTLYIYRKSSACNPSLTEFAILRQMNPMLKAITIDGRDGVINEAAKTVAVTIPYEADLDALTVVPTIAWNGAHATTPTQVTSNEGAWVLAESGDNTYRVMDKDGDYTDYTITLTRDVLKHTVSFNTHGGSAVASVDVEDGKKLAAAPADPEKEDYLFQGWAETDGGAIVDVTSFAISADKEFHAVWAADGGIKLIIDGAGETKVINSDYFTTGATIGSKITVSAVEYDNARLSGTASDLTQGESVKYIAYSAQSTKTRIKLTACATDGTRYVYLHTLEEGASTASIRAAEYTITTAISHEEFVSESAANRTIYFSVPSDAAKVCFIQVKVLEEGTPLKCAGEVGYSLNLNQGRLFGNTADLQFEGLTYTPSSKYTTLSSTELQVKSNVAFTTTTPVTLALTTTAAKYYVSQDAAEDGTTATEITATGEQKIVLAAAGTWYIVPSTTSAVKITNIAFAAPRKITFDSDGGSAVADVYVADGEAATEPAEPTKTSWDFDGWYNGADLYDWSAAVTADLALTAHWKVPDPKYSITYNINGGEGAAPTETDKAAGKVFALAAAPSRTDYNFAGWLCNIDDVTYAAGVSYTMTAAATTFTAQWVPQDCKIYSLTGAIGSAEGTAGSYEVNAGSLVLKNTNARIKLTPAAYETFKAGDVVTISGTVGNTERKFGVIIYAENGSTELGKIEVTGSNAILQGSVALSGNANYLLLKRVDTTTETFYTFEISRSCAAGTAADFAYAEGTVTKKLHDPAFINPLTNDNGLAVIYHSSNLDVAKVNALTGQVEMKGAGTATITAYAGPQTKAGVLYEAGSATYSITVKGPDYTRSVSNNIGTLCVDHNVPSDGALGATFYQIAGKNEVGKLVFDEVTVLKAGEPYVFQSTTGEIALYYGETSVADPVQVNGMVGVFSDTEVEITEENKSNIMYIAQNTLWTCNNYMTFTNQKLQVAANRAYIYDYSAIEAPSSSPAPGRRRITLGVNGEQTATDIDNLNASEKPVKLLIDGQLFIIRGEKMFDATGRLVK